MALRVMGRGADLMEEMALDALRQDELPPRPPSGSALRNTGVPPRCWGGTTDNFPRALSGSG